MTAPYSASPGLPPPRRSEAGVAAVTGGAGFLGSHLCERLLADGWRVLALDNLSTGDAENLQQLRHNPLFEFVHHDVTRPLPAAKHRLDTVCGDCKTLLRIQRGGYSVSGIAREQE